MIQADHPRTDPFAKIQVASVQTLARRDRPMATVVIVDEAHIGSKVIRDWMAEKPDVIFIGLSATPWRKGMAAEYDDLVCGAEALTDASVTLYDSDGNVIETVRSDYTLPFNPGDLLGYGDLRAGEFAAYDEIAPRLRIYVGTDPLLEWFGNFNADDSDQPSFGGDGRVTDGDDLIFGDLGNDWLIGGTGRDHMWGGYGNDLINADDDHEINGPNDTPDSDYSYEDIVFGGAGRDVMIGNTGGDRLIDWVGEFNSYIVPFAPFGAFAISRQLSPALQEYLYDLSEADGTDMTRSADTGNDAARNGEPDGEIGLVTQQDEDWQTQTGAPNDPQPGNIAGGKRDVLRGSDFNGTATTSGFAADSGSWEISGGRLEISPTEPGGDAASVYHLSEYLPTYFEVVATINAAKPTGGAKSNAYIIFDYISPTNFKFAGVNISTDKIELGRRTEEGWIVDKQTPVRVRPNQNYDILLVVNGTTATLVVDGQDVFTHVFAPFIDQYGVSHGLNAGMIGLGAVNSVARIDNLRVQILEREVTYKAHEDFEDTALLAFTGLDTAAIADSRIDVTGGQFFSAGLEVDENHVIRMEAHVELSGRAGFYFDAYEDGSYKFAILDANTNQLLIGHNDERRGFRVLYAVSADLSTTMLHDVQLTLKGTTVSVVLDGNTLKGFAFFAPVTDGDAGLLTIDDAAFAYVMSMTDDPMMLVDGAVEILGEAEDNFGTGPDQQGTGSKIWFYENSVGGAIPDRGTLISVISVSEGFDLADLDVTITVSHRKLSTLIVELIAPDGTVILLASNLGGDGFTATVFDDDAAAAIADGAGSFTGVFRPMGDLTRLEGMAATGDWTLRITDSQKRNTGDLQSWSLAFTETTPAAMVATLLGDAEAIQAPGPAAIDTTLQAAVDWWIANADLSEEEIALLYSVEIELASLDGTLLATTNGNIVTLDADAAGHGWWIDPTPDDSDEFNADGRATDGNVGGMDLLSVLIHELGHVLGENHSTDGVMEESLAPATRTGLSEDIPTNEVLTMSTSSAAGAVIFAGQNLAKSRYVDWRRVA